MKVQSIHFRSFKCLKNLKVRLEDFNVLAGPNNADKSTILDGLRALSGALRHARRFNPRFLYTLDHEEIFAHEIPESSIPINMVNVFHNYNTDDAEITFNLPSRRRLKLRFRASRLPTLEVYDQLGSPASASVFRSRFPIQIGIVPTLGPFEEEESPVERDYIKRWGTTRRGHRLFRNIWYHDSSQFDDFKTLLNEHWKWISIEKVKLQGPPPRLVMFFREGLFTREIYWSGFGLQVWMQTITHFLYFKDSTIFLLDEPDIYLHPNLQIRLVDMLRKSAKQIVIATHSVEIINSCDFGEICSVDTTSGYAKRLDDLDSYKIL